MNDVAIYIATGKGLDSILLLRSMKCETSLSSFMNRLARFVLLSMCRILTIVSRTDLLIAFLRI